MSNGAHTDVDPVVREGIKRIEAKLAGIEAKLAEIDAKLEKLKPKHSRLT